MCQPICDYYSFIPNTVKEISFGKIFNQPIKRFIPCNVNNKNGNIITNKNYILKKNQINNNIKNIVFINVLPLNMYVVNPF